MDTGNWAEFPHARGPFDYPGNRLEQSWAVLHTGDCEPWPDAGRVAAIMAECPQAGVTGDAAAVAARWQDAWRAFHRGDFAQAVEQAVALGPVAHAVANKAATIYADYLEEDDDTKLAIYQACIERAEQALTLFPDDPNTHYFHAFAMGRYSQGISVTRALSQGLGGKIGHALASTLELQPEHAEAHTALGVYNAEIIDKVGKLVGGMTYGATREKAEHHCRRALELTPAAPIAHIEYGNCLYLLYGDKRLEDSNAAYADAARLKPMDAMQKLDVEYARASLA